MEEAAAERWGLVWEPEEGPVWGNMANAEEEKQEDDWTQLLREGVSGITTDSEGVYRCACPIPPASNSGIMVRFK